MSSRDALLLSGGLDSAALAAFATPSHAIFIDYGQVCAVSEGRAARAIAASLDIGFSVVQVDCRTIGSGDLSGTAPSKFGPSQEWWPYRNQLLATLAAAKALELRCERLLFATVASDGFHADGRQRFFELLDALIADQEGGLHVAAPVIALTSVELIRKAAVDMSLLGWTHSCHIGNAPCGECRGCVKRSSVLKETGLRA